MIHIIGFGSLSFVCAVLWGIFNLGKALGMQGKAEEASKA